VGDMSEIPTFGHRTLTTTHYPVSESMYDVACEVKGKNGWIWVKQVVLNREIREVNAHKVIANTATKAPKPAVSISFFSRRPTSDAPCQLLFSFHDNVHIAYKMLDMVFGEELLAERPMNELKKVIDKLYPCEDKP
jgi:hypothetical protein